MPATLTNKIIGNPFIELNTVDSTNNYAMQQLKSGAAKHGTVYFAHEQTAGKGQRGKQWFSAKKENIILSVILQTHRLFMAQQFFLNVISSLAAFNLFNKYTTNNLKIKWPNDVYWQDRKTGGILIENIISGNTCKYAVAGFGLNINQTAFHPALKNPCSLKQITGRDYDVIELSHQLCDELTLTFNRLMNGDVNGLLKEYKQHLYKKDSIVKFKKDAIIFEGKIIRVDEAGRLMVQTSYEEAFEFGSVEWIIDK